MGGLVLPEKDPIFTANMKLDGFAHLKVKKPNKAQDWVTYGNQNKIFFEGNSHCYEPVIILDGTGDEGMTTTLQEQF